MEQLINTISAQERKVADLYAKVLDTISDNVINDACERDSECHNLRIDYEKALNKKKFTDANTLRRRILHRRVAITEELTKKKMEKMLVSGEIVQFMEMEDAGRFELCRARIFLAMDVLDSTLNDLQAFLTNMGIRGDIERLKEIDNAREAIQFWCTTSIKNNDKQVLGFILDESDKVYDHLNSRLPVMFRKINRQLKSQDVHVGPKEYWASKE